MYISLWLPYSQPTYQIKCAWYTTSVSYYITGCQYYVTWRKQDIKNLFLINIILKHHQAGR